MGNPRIMPLSKDYVPPDGLPSVTELNQRVMNAANRLQVRGVMPQPNPLVTAWQVRALVHLMAKANLLDTDEYMYFTALFQTEDLERLVEEKPPSGIVVPQSQVQPIELLKKGN